MKLWGAFFLFAFLAARAAAAPCQDVGAGAVVDFDHPSTAYRLERRGEEIPLQYFMGLEAGDRLSFDHDGFVSIQSSSGTATWYRVNTPICIVAGKTPDWLERLQASITDRLTRSRDRGRVATITRGEGPLRLAFADMEPGPAVIAAGERRIAFGWKGGTPPFEVRLTDGAGSLIVDEQDITSHTLILLAPRSLTEGELTLLILDSSGAGPVTASLRVVNEDLPPVSDAGSAMARAAELAADGRALDAFMTLSPYRRERASVAEFMAILAGD